MDSPVYWVQTHHTIINCNLPPDDNECKLEALSLVNMNSERTSRKQYDTHWSLLHLILDFVQKVKTSGEIFWIRLFMICRFGEVDEPIETSWQFPPPQEPAQSWTFRQRLVSAHYPSMKPITDSSIAYHSIDALVAFQGWALLQYIERPPPFGMSIRLKSSGGTGNSMVL